MKIGLVVPNWSAEGGVTRGARLMIRQLQELDHEVVVISPAESRRDHLSRRLAAPQTWIGFPKSALLLENSLQVVKCGSTLAEWEPNRYRPTRVATKAMESCSAVLVVSGTPAWINVAHDTKVPVIAKFATTVHWERQSRDDAEKPMKRSYRRAMTRRVSRIELQALKVPRAVMVENSHTLEWVRGLVHAGVSTSLYYPGVDEEFWSPPQSWNQSGPFVSIGRLAEARKGWPRLLSAFATFTKMAPFDDRALVIAGSGDLVPQDWQLIHSLGLAGRVHVVSSPSDWELRQLLQDASCYVQASFEEGLGLAALQAMAVGLPVVSSATAGAHEYVLPGVTGYLVPVRVSNWGDQLSRALIDVIDGAGRELGYASRREVERRFTQRHGRDTLASALASTVSPHG